MLRPLRPLALSTLLLAACASTPPRPPTAPPPAPCPAASPPPDHATALTPLPTTPEPPPAPIDPRAARLLRLCRVWGEVRYQHPWVVAGKVDWDAALVSVLPKALAAQTDGDEVAATKDLLDSLHDPLTRVENPTARTLAAPAASTPSTDVRTVEGVTFIPLHAADWSDAGPAGERLAAELAKAKLAVVDVRGIPEDDRWLTAMAIESVASRLARHDGVGVTRRSVEHRGFRSQREPGSSDYATLFTSSFPASYSAAPGPHPSRVVFIADDARTLPDVVWAMQRAGDALVVVQGAPSADDLAWTDSEDLSGGYVARVRVNEVTGGLASPDLHLDPSMPDAKVEQLAIQAAKHPPARKRADRAAADSLFHWHLDATYAGETYPSREHRVLALFRFWSVIHFFYPYLPLMGDPWDRAVAEFIPRFEGAADAREYALAVAELAARIPDGHVDVSGSSELDRVKGDGRPPFRVQMIGGEMVVTGMLDEAALGDAKLAVGDVVLEIDGEPVATRLARVSKYVPASNEAARAKYAAWRALRGDLATKLSLTVRSVGSHGAETRKVSVARTKWIELPERTGPVVRLLEGGIGYVDLDRLEVKDVDAMFTTLAKAPSIVFDMRGYPHLTAPAIAPRLNTRGATVAAQFLEPFVSPGAVPFTFFPQPIPATDKPLYRGKTVMLIDERTQSQAEHTGLFLEAAAGTTFIGSQTAGANGDITELSLPGGIYVSFSGRDIRHTDGRQLQRIGLVPAIEARPTIDGIRAGRDEVLERAVTYLQTGK